MKVINKVIQCEIFYFILAWILWFIIYLLLNIFFWIDKINNRLTDIEDKLNEPLTIDLQKY